MKKKYSQLVFAIGMPLLVVLQLFLMQISHEYDTVSLKYAIPIVFSVTKIYLNFAVFISILWLLASVYSVFYITKNHDYKNSNNLLNPLTSSEKSVFDKVLFSILIGERKKIAKSKGIPPYVIFQESSIEEMAMKFPISISELKNINGVGEGKAIKFGEPFVILINEYVKENEIIRPEDLVVKTTGTNSALKLFIIQSIDRKLQPLDIADSKGIELSVLIKELETIVFSGTKLDINYMIDEIFDEDQQEELYDYFIDSQSDDINLAIDEFDGDYEELDLKLYRIKFINDVSN